MMPVPLSYFSPLVGGLRGATALGMEPTYFWDGLSDEAIDWLNMHTPPGRSVRFATFPTSWLYLKQTGRFRFPLAPIDPGKPAWLVIQNRPGAFRLVFDTRAGVHEVGQAQLRRRQARRAAGPHLSLPGLIDPCRLAKGNDPPNRRPASRAEPGGWECAPGPDHRVAGHGADRRRHRPDLGRTFVPNQPARLGPVVGGAAGRPGPGRIARPLLSPEALLYYWPYARFGYNFHPPLAGQLNLLTHALFGGFMKDIPSRRMASVIEYALTITLAFGFLTRRYGAWVGGVAAGALLVMPRVYGDGHIAGTDTPGLLLWVITALAFWKGLYEPHARKWRVLVGIALGLGFVEKMAAVAVLGPLLFWLVVGPIAEVIREQGRPSRLDRRRARARRLAMLVPLGFAFREVLRLARGFPTPDRTDLFSMHPPTSLPGVVLLLPLLVWVGRRLLGLIFPRHPVWGAGASGPGNLDGDPWRSARIVGWLGNPAWWCEDAARRMAHYYQLSKDRGGALPPTSASSISARSTTTASPAQCLGPDRDHGAGRDLAGGAGGLVFEPHPVVEGPRRDPLVLRPTPRLPPPCLGCCRPHSRRRPPLSCRRSSSSRSSPAGVSWRLVMRWPGWSGNGSRAEGWSRPWCSARRPGSLRRSTLSSCRSITTS